MADMNPIKYFVAVLIVVVLFSVLATYAGEKAEDDDLGTDGTGYLNQTVLTENSTSTTLTLSNGDATLTSLTTAVAKNNSWLEFDGDNDYIVNQTPWSQGGSMTINIWVNRTGNTSTSQYFFESLTGTTPVFMCNNAEQLQFSAGGVWCLTPERVCDDYDGVWTMYTQVFNGSRYILYINGTEVNYSAVGGGTTYKGFEIGGSINDGDGTPTVNGSIDELRVYNVSLTATQLAEIYASGIKANESINDTGLVLWMKFDEGSSVVAHGIEPNKTNGTISGGVWQDDNINVTLVENTDYTLSSNIFTIINDTYAWIGIDTYYIDDWNTEYGFHKSIMDLVAGFVALSALTFVILILFKILKENGIIN